MSRRRDTNWNRDEITVLLDSIIEVTKMKDVDGKRTNSREVFEYAAKKLGESGHTSRAEREKCRTKWKKMKEEFTHAKKARDGDTRYKEAPGIQPFYERIQEFINGNFANISPHSTIVRRSSSISSSNNTTSTNATTASSSSSSSSSGTSCKNSPVSRSSARLAANQTATGATDGVAPMESDDIPNNAPTAEMASLQKSSAPTLSNTPSRQPSSRASLASDSNTSTINSHSNVSNNLFPTSLANQNVARNGTNCRAPVSQVPNQQDPPHQLQQQPRLSLQRQTNNYSQLALQHQAQRHESQQLAIQNGEIGSVNAYNHDATHNGQKFKNSTSTLGNQQNNSSMQDHAHDNPSLLPSNHQQASPAEHADISYRVSSGCRQITIFGDHDVDIKFRGDCVTINKISTDYDNC